MSLFTDRAVIDEMHAANHKAEGVNYCFAMRQGDAIKVITRQNCPCYGDMRPYGKHSTRPQDSRPSDLKKDFPKGIPEAVGFKFTCFGPYQAGPANDQTDEFFRAYFGPESPFLKGFGSPEAVEFTMNAEGHIIGAVLLDTEIDPTVLVSALMTARDNSYIVKRFSEVKQLSGGSDFEALVITMYTADHYNGTGMFVGYANSYTIAANPDLKRMKSNPRDLTGGTFRNRYAYNRPELHEVFKYDDPTRKIFYHGKLPTKPHPYNSYIQQAIPASKSEWYPKFVEMIREEVNS